jgi:hypothetical protein
MIDLLLLNPGEHAESFCQVLTANNVSYQIVTTPGQMFAYSSELEVFDLNVNPWDYTQQYKSGISWNRGGQKWLDHVSEQIVLNNKPLNNRISHYLLNKFEVELGKMFNILSYKGRHVLIDAFVYKNNKWHLIKDQTLPFFVNGVESAFTFLDSVGLLNGPSQVFIEPDGKISIRMIPKINTQKISTRTFLDIWPYVLTLEVEQPKKAILAFYSWVERTGPAKQFQLETGL